MKIIEPGRIAIMIILTLGVVYWLRPLPTAAIIVIGLVIYGILSILHIIITKVFFKRKDGN